MPGARLAFFKASRNYIRFPEERNNFGKRALKILTKPDGLAPFPFANRTQFDDKRTSLKKSINRHGDKLKAETKSHSMPEC